MVRLCAQGLAEMEELDSLLCEDEDTPGCDTPAGAGPASVEADPQGARRPDAKASAAGRNRLKALRTRMVQQVQLLFNELDRHGGAERLEASASRGAGSTDHRAADDFAGRFGGVHTLGVVQLQEMSLDEVCETLVARGRDGLVGLFERECLDGAKLSVMDEAALLDLGLDRALCAAVVSGRL